MSSLLTSVIDELQASLYILVHNVALRFKIEEKELDVKVKDGLHEIKTFTYTRFIWKVYQVSILLLGPIICTLINKEVKKTWFL